MAEPASSSAVAEDGVDTASARDNGSVSNYSTIVGDSVRSDDGEEIIGPPTRSTTRTERPLRETCPRVAIRQAEKWAGIAAARDEARHVGNCGWRFDRVRGSLG